MVWNLWVAATIDKISYTMGTLIQSREANVCSCLALYIHQTLKVCGTDLCHTKQLKKIILVGSDRACSRFVNMLLKIILGSLLSFEFLSSTLNLSSPSTSSSASIFYFFRTDFWHLWDRMFIWIRFDSGLYRNNFLQ